MSDRYARQVLLPEVGERGQSKFGLAKVLVLGAGGLGCPILTYLNAAGIGTLGVVDDDVVDESNLHRQVLYSMEDIGTPKVTAAARRLRQLNPHTQIVEYRARLTASNVLEIFSAFDVIVDGTDNFAAKYLASDACFRLGKPLVYASISQFDGQLSVFNHMTHHGRGPNYRDLFPEPPPAHLAPNCQEAGVLGVLPGILGCLQATEVLKLILGAGDVLSGKLLCIDALTMSFRTFELTTRDDNPLYAVSPAEVILKDIARDGYCGLEENGQWEISVPTFLEWRAESRPLLVVDVRNAEERTRTVEDSVSIPLSDLPLQLERLRVADRIVIYCQSGVRSRAALSIIRSAMPTSKAYSLRGGMREYLQHSESKDSTAV